MRTVAIVQARMGSTRLPGKVMRDLSGRPVLAHVLRRCQAIEGVDAVCCATTRGDDAQAIILEAERQGSAVYRGGDDDVLGRYHGAAVACEADVVLRVTSDCPVIDPEICAGVIALRATEEAEYACNNMPRGWPHGLDCEAFTVEALKLANENATDAYEREHVTPWLRTNPMLKRVNLRGPGGEDLRYRLTLDFPEDFSFFVALSDRIELVEPIARYADIIEALRSEPEIGHINAHRREASRPEPAMATLEQRTF